MEQTLITTFVQLGAFGVLAYLVIRWQREDITASRQQLAELVNKFIEAQSKTNDHLELVAQTLGMLCDKIDHITPTTPKQKE